MWSYSLYTLCCSSCKLKTYKVIADDNTHLWNTSPVSLKYFQIPVSGIVGDLDRSPSSMISACLFISKFRCLRTTLLLLPHIASLALASRFDGKPRIIVFECIFIEPSTFENIFLYDLFSLMTLLADEESIMGSSNLDLKSDLFTSVSSESRYGSNFPNRLETTSL